MCNWGYIPYKWSYCTTHLYLVGPYQGASSLVDVDFLRVNFSTWWTKNFQMG